MTKLPPGALGICQTFGGSGNSHSASRHISAALTRIACAMFRPLQQLALFSLTLPLLLACASSPASTPEPEPELASEPLTAAKRSAQETPEQRQARYDRVIAERLREIEDLKANPDETPNVINHDAFAALPVMTAWRIASLTDFEASKNYYAYLSAPRKTLSNYRVVAERTASAQMFILRSIPACEGAGHQFRTVEDKDAPTKKFKRIIEYIHLQGACSEPVTLPDGTQAEVISFETLLSKHIGPESGAGQWELRGDRLILRGKDGAARAEFTREEIDVPENGHLKKYVPREQGAKPE